MEMRFLAVGFASALLLHGADRSQDVHKKVGPLFQTSDRCFACHNGLATSGGLPESRRDAASPLVSSSGLSDSRSSNPSSATVFHYAPRGPPVSHLLG